MQSKTIITQPVFYILLVLSIKKSHGYEIMKNVSKYSSDSVKLGPGTLYGALKRMLDDKLISEEEVGQNSRRRYYIITEKGIDILSSELDRLSSAIAISKQSSFLPINNGYSSFI